MSKSFSALAAGILGTNGYFQSVPFKSRNQPIDRQSAEDFNKVGDSFFKRFAAAR